MHVLPHYMTQEPTPTAKEIDSYEKFVGAKLTLLPEAVSANWRRSREARIVDVEIDHLGVTYFMKVEKMSGLHTISAAALIKRVKDETIIIDSLFPA